MFKAPPSKGTGRSKFPFQLFCEEVEVVSPTRLWGSVKNAFTDKGRFKISSDCDDLINSLEIGQRYYFQYFTLSDQKTVVDLLLKN